MTELKTQGFHHVTLVSSDAAKTLDFYRGTLGLELVKRTTEDSGVPHLYFGDAPGTLVTVVEQPGAPRGAPGVGGVHHLALAADTEESLLKWKRRLTDAGAHVNGPYDRTWFTSLYFTDPDGQILEIATKGPGYALDEPAGALGERIVRPAAERLAGGRDEAAIRARAWPEPVPAVTPDMALRGIHHVSGITDDVERAHDFYTEALGLRIVKRTFNQDSPTMPHWFWARYDGAEVAPHSSMTLFGIPRGKLAREGVGQAQIVAFRARGDEELRAWRERLLEWGTEVSPVLDRTWFRSIRFRAPDGLLLEIATDGPGFAAGDAPLR